MSNNFWESKHYHEFSYHTKRCLDLIHQKLYSRFMERISYFCWHWAAVKTVVILGWSQMRFPCNTCLILTTCTCAFHFSHWIIYCQKGRLFLNMIRLWITQLSMILHWVRFSWLHHKLLNVMYTFIFLACQIFFIS